LVDKFDIGYFAFGQLLVAGAKTYRPYDMYIENRILYATRDVGMVLTLIK
jgi:hypothetical protein